MDAARSKFRKVYADVIEDIEEGLRSSLATGRIQSCNTELTADERGS